MDCSCPKKKKDEAICEYKHPSIRKLVCAFLRLPGFYGRYVQFSVVGPFQILQGQAVLDDQLDKVHWTTTMEQAFQQLKEALTTSASPS